MISESIYLPQFPGFYNSILSDRIDDEENYLLECIIQGEYEQKLPPGSTYDDLMKIVDIDYKKNHDSYARAWYDKVKETIATRLLEDTSIRLMDYEKLVSPQFYNYSTDEVQISIEYDYDRMIQYLRDNEETFSQYILEKNTSYEGFHAFYSNNFQEYTKDFASAQLTQIIDFWIDQHNNEWYEKMFTLEIVTDLEWYLDYEFITPISNVQ